MSILKVIIILLLQSCAGYKLVGETNLFKVHGVSAVVVDQAKNNSSFSGITRYFANSITTELSSLPGFHIQNKLGKKTGEAVVVAELTSEPNPSRSKEVEAVKFIDKSTGYGTSIGNRAGFYVNSQIRYRLSLDITIIKNPKGSQKDLSQKAEIIFKKSYPVTFQMNNSLLPNTGQGSLGLTNFVMNKSIEEKAFELAAQDVAILLRRDLEH